MIEFILSKLFPPQLPSPIRDWGNRIEIQFEEQGSAGNVKPGAYRNGIERHFAEEAQQKPYRLNTAQYFTQLRSAEIQMALEVHHLIDQGYVNTIQDCWERPEE